MISVLFVCMDNICRSPALQATLESLCKNIHVDSCGMGGWFVGQQVDKRMQHIARKRGIEIQHIAQIFHENFFDTFEYIFAVDKYVLEELQSMAPKKTKLFLATHFSEKYKDRDIPDPYYDGEIGFENVMDMIEDSCRGIHHFLQSST